MQQKAGWAHSRSRCFAEEQNPLLILGIGHYRQGHKLVSLDVMSSVVEATVGQQTPSKHSLNRSLLLVRFAPISCAVIWVTELLFRINEITIICASSVTNSAILNFAAKHDAFL